MDWREAADYMGQSGELIHLRTALLRRGLIRAARPEDETGDYGDVRTFLPRKA